MNLELFKVRLPESVRVPPLSVRVDALESARRPEPVTVNVPLFVVVVVSSWCVFAPAMETVAPGSFVWPASM